MNIKPPLRRRKIRRKEGLYETKVYYGTVLIPDISGFTKFVRTTDFMTGKNVTSRLLSSILQSNHLGMQVSEIEGDAVLFYKYNKKFTVKEILNQYEIMLESFNQEIDLLSEELGEKIDLTLKLIAHYGKLADYKIGRFRKLYGETVIDAHRLLKNTVNSNTYVLITDDLLVSPYINKNSIAQRFCDRYDEIKKICYTLFDYQINRMPALTA